MRSLVILLCLLAAPAAPAAANDFCDENWFTRNLLFDRAGHCFGSPLGQAVFDNSDCIAADVTLSAEAQAVVDAIKRREARVGCDVDTSRIALDLDDIEIRRKLTVLPIIDEFAMGCIGWREAQTPLHAGPDAGSMVIGRIEPGDSVNVFHVEREGWTYVTARDAEWRLKSGGWLGMELGEQSCEQWAG